MELDQLKDTLIEKKKLLKDRIYKWKLMKQFGDRCPRCSRKLINFSVHDNCYKKFLTLSHREKGSRIGKRQKGKCVVCGKIAIEKQRVFCEFCGYYK